MDVLGTMESHGEELVVQQEGHFLGYLEFDASWLSPTRLEELAVWGPPASDAGSFGLQLVFCYANHVAFVGHVGSNAHLCSTMEGMLADGHDLACITPK